MRKFLISNFKFQILNKELVIGHLKFGIGSSRRMREGFTLIEMLIYMGLLAILMTVMTSLFSSILDVQLESQASSSVDQDGRYLLSRLMYDIQRADSITTPSSLGSQTGNLQIVISGIIYSYALSGGNLQITNNFGTDNLNSTESTVSNLSFLRLGNVNGKNSIQLGFTVTSKTLKTSGTESKNFTTTVGIR